MDDLENEISTDSIDQSTESGSEAPEGQSAPDNNEVAYEKGVKLSEKINQDPEVLTKSQVAQLEKLEKVRYNGKVISGKELAKELKEGTLRLSDYTKKTQEIAQERKFYDALPHDLQKLRDNPELASEFRKVYPAKFHAYLDILESKGINAATQAVEQQDQKLDQEPQKADWKQDPELKEMFNSFQEQRLETARVQVNTMFDKLVAKYPDADDSWVAGRVQAEREQIRQQSPGQKLPPLDEATVEKHFKESQMAFEKRAAAWNAKRFQAQKSASDKAKGPGAGGGIPGGAPKQVRTIKEATELAMADPNFN